MSVAMLHGRLSAPYLLHKRYSHSDYTKANIDNHFNQQPRHFTHTCNRHTLNMSSSGQTGGNTGGGGASGGGAGGGSTNPPLRHKEKVDGSLRDKSAKDANPPPGSGQGPPFSSDWGRESMREANSRGR